MGPGLRRDGDFFISVAPVSAAPDAAAGGAGLLFGAAQALGCVGGGVAGAVEKDRLAEIVVAEPAPIGAALGRLAGDLAASDPVGRAVVVVADPDADHHVTGEPDKPGVAVFIGRPSLAGRSAVDARRLPGAFGDDGLQELHHRRAVPLGPLV